MRNTDLYKGYVPTKKKTAISDFKDSKPKDLLTLEEAEKLPEYGGVLKADTILIDIDDGSQSDIMFKIVQDKKLKCKVIKTTRGKHFLFRNHELTSNKTHTALAIGLIADIKLGSRNSYEVLKYDGELREVLYDCKTYDFVPKYFWPVNAKIDVVNMAEDTGRNQTLFNYIINLQKNDFSKNESREVLRLINDYVFKTPLPASELTTIMRDGAFSKKIFFGPNGEFEFQDFAKFLISECYIRKINGVVHIYRNGIYVSGFNAIESEMIKFIPHLSMAKRREVISYLRLLFSKESPSESFVDANKIAFKNGVYDIETGKFGEFSPDYLVTNLINWDWQPDAYNELADKTLTKLACGDPAIRKLLEEIIGFCFYRRNELGKAVILIGDKANGKSTFLAMIENVLGEENIASLDLAELDEKFKTVRLVGKLANIGDDIGDEFIPNTSMFKKLTTGDRVSVEEKGQPAFEFNNYSKLLFSANNIPRMKDKTGAVLRRLVIVPFKATFSKSDPDFRPYIKYELKAKEVAEYLIQIGLIGLKRVLKNQGFTESIKVENELKDYEYENNPILQFYDEVVNVEDEPTNELYEKYMGFCDKNGVKCVTRITFSKLVCKHFDLITRPNTVNGKSIRIFCKRK